MFRVSLANAFAKRTLRPLHEKHQATPVAVTLSSTLADNSTAIGDIYSGMVANIKTSGTEAGVVTRGVNGAVAYGLFALDSNPVINDLEGQPTDLRPFAIWQGGPDAYFRIDSPAFNTGGTITPGVFLYPDAAGKLAVSGQNSATNAESPAAQVVEVISSTRLVIRVLLPTAADVA